MDEWLVLKKTIYETEFVGKILRMIIIAMAGAGIVAICRDLLGIAKDKKTLGYLSVIWMFFCSWCVAVLYCPRATWRSTAFEAVAIGVLAALGYTGFWVKRYDGFLDFVDHILSMLTKLTSNILRMIDKGKK